MVVSLFILSIGTPAGKPLGSKSLGVCLKGMLVVERLGKLRFSE